MHERHTRPEREGGQTSTAAPSPRRVEEVSEYDFSSIDFTAPTVRRRLAAAYRVLLTRPLPQRLESER